ncbi:MAG: TonB-dependent receptor [Cytophagales bacterium]|nr:TonB-dependent receptor [Cytophagales bacterium]
MRQNLLIVCMLIIAGWVHAQSGSVTGKISDRDSYEALPGANVIIKGTSKGTTTDVNGRFTLGDLTPGSYALEISFIGYELKEMIATIRPNQATNLGDIRLATSSIGLREVEVIASVAIDRRTPVAFTSIEGQEIESKVGNQEFPEMLRYTPSIYVTKQGGGFGDSRINVRGFDQRNTAVMINGVPVNDMENGWVYWSNWAGLSDVTTKMQVQRGLGASKLAVPAIGGSINIITNAAEMNKGGAFGAMLGNDGYQKYSLVLSTGLGESGWAFTIQGTHTLGNGYVDGTKFRGWSYFASLSKVINTQHSIGLTVLGAPQWHHQRDYANPYTDHEKYGTKYNSDWGYLNGSEYTWRRNFYHKPKAFLNWYWTISDRTELATSAYLSLGRGGGTGPRGEINGNAEYKLPKTSDGLHRFDDIYKWNNGGSVPDFGDDRETWENVNPDVDNRNDFFADKYVNTNSYGLIRRASMNSHNWYGIISNLTHQLSESFTLTTGVDLRKYQGIHYRRVTDLLGADAYYTNANINIQGQFISEENPADPLSKMGGEDKLHYYNDGIVSWAGAYAQIEYVKDKISTFLSLSGSNQGFKRVDYFNYYQSDALNRANGVDENMESNWENFLGGNIKAGLNYNIDQRHNVFINAGYLSRQPIFDNVFPNNTNQVSNETSNQKIAAIELGYGFRNSIAALNVNFYRTQWIDRQFSRSINTEGGEYTANFSVDQTHQGIELDFVIKPVERLNIKGMLSVGDWKYRSNSRALVFDDNQNQVADTTIYLDGVKVGDAAQTTFSLGADYEILTGLGVDANYYYANNLYADFNIVEDDFFFEEGSQAWKLPSYGLVDIGAFYTFKVSKVDFTLRLNVNNVLDDEYISESDTNKLYDPESGSDRLIPDSENGSVSNRIFYGFGRTWNLGLKVRF